MRIFKGRVKITMNNKKKALTTLKQKFFIDDILITDLIIYNLQFSLVWEVSKWYTTHKLIVISSCKTNSIYMKKKIVK